MQAAHRAAARGTVEMAQRMRAPTVPAQIMQPGSEATFLSFVGLALLVRLGALALGHRDSSSIVALSSGTIASHANASWRRCRIASAAAGSP